MKTDMDNIMCGEKTTPVLCAALTSPCLSTSRTQVLTSDFFSPPTTDTTRLGCGSFQCSLMILKTLEESVVLERRKNWDKEKGSEIKTGINGEKQL